MKRSAAWNGFFKAVKEIKACEAQAKKDGHDCNVRIRWKMADMRARRFCKSLVLEHGYQDIHTSKYMVVEKKE